MAKLDKNKALLEAIIDRTEDWSKEVFVVEDKQTQKAKKLSKILSDLSHTASDKERFAELVSEITGEKVKIEKDADIEFHSLVALVLTKVTDKHKHTYETDTVIISLKDGTAITPEGKLGSPIPPSRSIMRPATKEEIEKIPETQIKGIFKETEIEFV